MSCTDYEFLFHCNILRKLTSDSDCNCKLQRPQVLDDAAR